ncbi:UNVERIFIED_ORG: hypothetical protein ABIC54_006421 [Burkholderia sp. 1263]
MAGSLITITDAGRAALVAPGNAGTRAHRIVEIGLASAAFLADRSMKALPSERKRITTFAGENVAPDTIHVTLRDDTTDQYPLYGFGLYLEDGVLAALYGQVTPIMEKSPEALVLLSADIQFTTIDAAQLVFGETSFTNPPATTERQGVVELATSAETIAGTDTQRAVTPAGLTAAIGPAIAGKSDKGHKHVISDVDGLQSALDTRLGVGGGEVSGAVRLKSASQYSPHLILDANGYAPFLRSDSIARALEAVNAANTAVNASLDDNGVLALPRARPSWAGYTPWDSGNLNPYTKAGGELNGNAAFQTRSGYGVDVFRALAADGTGIGGAYAAWNTTRAPALQIDAPASTSAYMGLRWTRQGGRHLAAIDAYEGGSATSAPRIDFHVDGQQNAWSFGRTDIARGAGGTVYGTWNFDPATRVSKEGDTMRNVLNVTNSNNDLNGYQSTIYPGAVKLNQWDYGPYIDMARARDQDYRWRMHYNIGNENLEFLANGGQNVQFTRDGNIYSGGRGYVWDAITARAPIRNGNAGYGYVISDTGNVITINWDGNLNSYVDGQYQGALITHSNFGNWCAPRSIVDYGGVGSYTISTQYHTPTQNGLYNLAGFGGTWRCMGPGLGGSNNDALYVRIS